MTETEKTIFKCQVLQSLAAKGYKRMISALGTGFITEVRGIDKDGSLISEQFSMEDVLKPC